MASLNRVMFIGRLTADPEESRTLPNGSTVIKFRFAVGRSRKNAQTGQWENDPNPLYLDCEAFSRPDAKRDLVSLISQYLRKGNEVYLEGRLVLDQWDDKTTGDKRSKHKMVVESLEMLGGGAPRTPGDGEAEAPVGVKAPAAGKKPAAGAKSQKVTAPVDGDDEGQIPF